MADEELEKAVNDILCATRDFLKHAVRKSGISGDLESLKMMFTFRMNDNRMHSMLLGEYMPPSEKYPDGEIVIHIDSIVDYSGHLGVDYWSLVAKVAMCQVHHALTWKSKGKFDYDKAERFASKICRKLARQNIISDIRPKIYLQASDKLNVTVRQQWLEKWVGEASYEHLKNMNHAHEVPLEENKE